MINRNQIRPKASRKDQGGFTLLEVVIALALISFVLMSVYAVQTTSVFGSTRARNVAIATGLARNLLAETEMLYDKLSFTEMNEDERGEFPDPNKDFTWRRQVEETDFSALTDLLIASKQGQADSGVAQEELTMMSKFQEYLKDSVRKVTVTIEWPEGDGKNSIAFTSLWVKYDVKLKSF